MERDRKTCQELRLRWIVCARFSMMRDNHFLRFIMPDAATNPMPLLLPTRGLVPLCTRDGKYRREEDLQRWLMLSRVAFKTLKCDLVDTGVHPALVLKLCAFAETEDIRVSLRTECIEAPKALAEMRDAGLLDVYLTPGAEGSANIDAWLDACAAADLPVRLQLANAIPGEPAAVATRLHEAGVVVLNIAAGTPLIGEGIPGSPSDVAWFQQLAHALDGLGVEVNFLGYPADVLDGPLRAHGLNRFRFFRDHQQYNAAAYNLAQQLLDTTQPKAATALLSLLANESSKLSKLDNFVLRFLLHKHDGWVARLAALNRLVRLWWGVGSLPDIVQGDPTHGNAGNYATEVSDCLSDPECASFQMRYPDIPFENTPLPEEGTPRHRYFDAVDTDRRSLSAGHEALAEEARAIIARRPHTRELDSQNYGSENAHVLDITGAVRWCSIARVEKRSTPLGIFEPGYTISATFGGGHAEFVGFAVGTYGRIMLPMPGLNHTLTLHVAADGNYVLLRDGQAVRPAEFEGGYYTPLRMPGRAELRLVLWNIDREITTHAVRVWEDDAAPETAIGEIKYSVLIPCTRYARRLQAVLKGIAEQAFDLSKIEVIIAYVPGVDATDDLIESMQSAYPALRIVRAPFAARDARAKGRMINESVKLATGEWVVLMDADIVLLPETFSAIDAASANTSFIAPDGRKMLDRETTGKLLLGLLSPSHDRDALLAGPGEYRRREAGEVPIGFMQCVKRECFETVQYEELGHFEGADWRFGQAIRTEFGGETWLEDLPVLHLDHGGSQWYGTQKHF